MPARNKMSENDDTAAKFLECCQGSEEYPLTVLRTETFSHTQRSLQAHLRQEGLFHNSSRQLYVRDLQDAATEFSKGRLLRGVEDIEILLDPEEKDPWWRFMSVEMLPSLPFGVTDLVLSQLLALVHIERCPRLFEGAARPASDIPPDHALVS